jgi:hypothetical protein
MEKIGNNYGAAFTPQSFVDFYVSQLKATDNNLVMRQQMASYGFSRVSRAFADEVMELIQPK